MARSVLLNVILRDRVSRRMTSMRRETQNLRRDFQSLSTGSAILGNSLASVEKGVYRPVKAFGLLSGATHLAVGGLNMIAVAATTVISSLGPLGASLGAIPGLFLAIGQGAGVVAFATHNMGKALGGSKKAYNSLTAEGKAFVDGLKRVNASLNGVRSNVQKALFKGLIDEIQKTVSISLPILQAGMVRTAQTINMFAIAILRMVQSPAWQKDLASISYYNNRALYQLGFVAMNVINILKNFAVALGPLTVRFASWLNKVTGSIDSMVQAKKESGQLAAFFQHAGDVAAQWGRILGNVAVGLFNVFKIGQTSSQNMTNMIERASKAFRDWTNSTAGKNQIAAWFREGEQSMKAMVSLIKDVGKAWMNTFGQIDSSGLINEIHKEWVPAIKKLMATFANTGAIKAFIQAIGTWLDIMAEVAHSGIITLVIQGFNLLGLAILGVIKYVPGAKQGLQLLFAVVLAMKIAQLTGLAYGFRALGGAVGWWTANTATGAAVQSRLLNALALLKIRVGLVALAVKAQTVQVLRNTGAWIANRARSAYSALMATRIGIVTRALAAQSIALARNGAAWVANRARAAAGAVASLARTIGMVTAALALQTAGILRNTVVWLANTAGTVANTIAKIACAVATGILSAATWILTGAFLANPITWIVLGVIALIAGIVILIRQLHLWGPIWNGLMAGMKATWGGFITFWNATKGALTFGWSATLHGMSVAWSATWHGILAAYNAVKNGLIAGFNILKNFILAAWRAITNFLRPVWTVAWNQIKNVAQVAWNAIKAVFNAFKTVALAIWRLVCDTMKALWTADWSKVRADAAAAWNAIKNLLNTMKNGILAIFRAIGTAIKSIWNAAWNAIVHALPSGPIRNAVMSLRTTIENLWRGLVNVLKAVWTPAWNAIKNVVTTAANAIKNVITSMKNVVVAIWRVLVDTIKALWTGNWGKVRQDLNVAWAAIRTTINTIKNGIIAVFNAIKSGVQAVWNALWNAVRSQLNGAWSAIRTTFNTLRAGAVAAFNAVRSGVQAAWSAMWNFVRAQFNSAWSALKTTFNTMKSWIKAAWDFIGHAAGGAWQAMWSFIRRIFNESWSALKATYNTMKSWIKAAMDFIGHAAGAAWQAMWSFIRRIFNESWSALKATYNTMKSWIKAAMDFIGHAAGAAWQAMWSFIRRIFNESWSALKATYNTMKSWIKAAMDFIGHAAGAAWQAMWSFIKRIFNEAWSALKTTFNTMKSWIKAAFDWIGHAAGTAWQAMWSFIRSNFSKAWNAIRTTFDTMKSYIPKVFDSIKSAVRTIWDGIMGVVAKPINFVIGFVADRLIPFANKALSLVLGKHAPQINAGALKGFKIPGFANGGIVDGYASGGVLPGYTPGRDIHIAHSPMGPIGLSGGEGILRPEVMRVPGMKALLFGANAAARHGGIGGVKKMLARENDHRMMPKILTAEGTYFKNGGMVSGVRTAANFDGGGIFDKIKSGVKAFADATIPGVGAVDWVKDQIVKKGFNILIDKVLGKIYNTALKWFGTFGPVGQIVGGAMNKVVSTIVNWVVDKTTPSDGGNWTVTGKGLQNAINFAKSQSGKPYQWGGGGNPSYDCSGFMASIERVMTGRGPGRLYTTHNFRGSMAPSGWKQNLNSPFMVGVTDAGVGHMAGTLAGQHVESASSRGVNYGPRARGHNDPMFKWRYGYAPATKMATQGGSKPGKGPGGSIGGSLASMSGTGAGGGGGGKAYFTHFWDPQTASGRPMSKTSIASSYIPLDSRLQVSKGGKSATGVIDDLGPAKFVYDRHPGVAVLDLAEGMLPGDGFGTFKILSVGKGRTLYGKNLRGYAKGGVIPPNTMGMVGENGPELFHSGTNKRTIMPNVQEALADAGIKIHVAEGAVQVAVHGNIDQKVADKLDEQFVNGLTMAIKAGVKK